MEKNLELEINKFKDLQKEYQKLVSAKSQYEAQLNENQMVLDELNLLEPKDVAFKLVGPVLVKQELTEAQQNVKKRIEYIQSESNRVDKCMKESETKQEATKNTVLKLQKEYQKQTQKAA
eukprot:Sdes_comp20357_c3_seq1m14143